MATISNVQAAKYGSAASNSVTVSWTSTPTAGNLLVARAIGVSATAAGAITGWTRVVSAQYGSTAGHVAIFFKIAGASEGNVTVTFTGATTTRLVIEEWSNSAGWAGSDVSANVNNTGSSVTSRSSGTTGTTAQADELAVAVWGAGGAVTSISFTNSFTSSFQQPTGSLTFWGAHKVLSATGTVETTASWTTARLCGGCVATFKGKLSGTIGQASETDAVLAVARAKRLTTGQPAETDTVMAMTGAKRLTIGQPSELDTPLAMTRAKRLTIGLIVETDTPISLGRAKRLTIGQPSELDAVFGMTVGEPPGVITGEIGVLTEEEFALPMLAVRVTKDISMVPYRDLEFSTPERGVLKVPERDHYFDM